MLDTWLPFEYVAIGLLGMAGAATGLIGMAACRKGRSGLLGCLALITLGVLAAGVAVGVTSNVRLPMGVLAGVCLGFGVARWAGLRGLIGRGLPVIWQPQLQWAVLLALSPALALCGVWQVESANLCSDLDASAVAELPRPPLHEVGKAYTDRGQSLPLFAPKASTVSVEELMAREPRHIPGGSASMSVMRRSTADVASNCFGWVFAEGRYWINGSEVAQILGENDYQVVPKPRAGDLAVYRDSEGTLVHVGVVRGAWEEDQVLVESKWGMLGRYLHAPEGSGYGSNLTYCRSPRSGHRLRGLNGETPSAPAELSARVGTGTE